MAVRTGLDRLAAGELRRLLDGRRVGLLCHAASVDAKLGHAIDVVRDGARLVAIFGPEHGVLATAQDMSAVGGGREPRTGLPVFSLYGDTVESLEPSSEALSLVDVLVCDLQDIGARYYTFVWTVLLAARAAARARPPVEIVVLDRPNPLGGVEVEGPGVERGFESFVGLCSVATRHGLTAGEIARLCAPSFAPDARVTVVPMEGWRREMHFQDTGLPWVLPSPNMPTADTALAYPGACLVEGTNLSEGRGTTRPFETVGAPFVDGDRLAAALASEDLPGARFRPLAFRPAFHKYAGQTCGGVQLHVTDRRAFRPLRTGVALLRVARALFSDHFRWRTEPYEFVAERPAIDLLYGSPRLRNLIEGGAALADIVAPWREAEASFRATRAPALLYD